MAAKRRLPLAPSSDTDTDPVRAAWQWVGFGTVAIFVAWLPLSAAATALASRLVGPASSNNDISPVAARAFVAMSALALGLAAGIGGFVVGRWGGAGVGVREATLAALAAAMVAVVASWASFGITLSALVVVPLALPFGAAGGRLGGLFR